MKVSNSLYVWNPKLTIPPDVISEASGLELFRKNHLDFVYAGGSRLIGCNGRCGWHTDEHIDPWSLLVVVRNDLGSSVVVKPESVVTEQPVGTAILLNVWTRHALIAPKPRIRGFWAAAVWDFGYQPTKAQCNALIRGWCADG